VTVVIAVWGASPGIGKSTLCAGLAGALPGRIDHFREEEILSRPAYADVAAEFEATGRIALATFREATARYVATIDPYDVVVADALLPYVPSLLAMGHSDAEVDAFVDRLAKALAGVRTVLLFLDGDPEAGLRRAAAREAAQEPGWLDWYVGKLAGYGVTPAVSDVASAAVYLAREREVTLRVAARAGWDVVVVDTTGRTAAEVLAVAVDALPVQVRSDRRS
jgi:hypothetical protein